MARIEDDRWIIETEEEAEAIAKLLNEPSKVNEKMQEALAAYRNLGYGESLDNLDLFEQTEAATHCKEDRVTEQNIEELTDYFLRLNVNDFSPEHFFVFMKAANKTLPGLVKFIRADQTDTLISLSGVK